MSRPGAPGANLGLVQEFVNTVDLQDGPEEFADPDTLKAWLVAKGMLDSAQQVNGADLHHAIALRESIRAVIGANSGLRVYPVDVATLNEAAAASRLRMRFASGGTPRLEPEAAGVVGAMGRIVAALYAAMEDESWTRLRLCGSQSCRWAFYDRSKNHSARWCSMSSCGNRAKARRFRSQKAKSPSAD